jgi:hypothetical protein
MDFGSHNKFAFRYACWEAGATPCNGEYCGTDLHGIKYTADVQIPPVYPDGDYVLGWSWYGGSRYFNSSELQYRGINAPEGHRTEYGDYYSCANIRIQGGQFDPSPFTPIFDPAQAGRSGTCASAANKLGICPVEPCNGLNPVLDMVPEPFSGGNSPAPILASDLGYSGNAATQGPSSTFNPSQPSYSTAPSSANSATGSSSVPAAGGQSSTVSINAFDFVNTGTNAVFYTAAVGSKAVQIPAAGIERQISIRADVSGSVKDVRFVASLTNTEQVIVDQTQYSGPYYIYGNSNGAPNAWQNIPVNNWVTLLATATATDGSQSTGQISFYVNSSA